MTTYVQDVKETEHLVKAFTRVYDLIRQKLGVLDDLRLLEDKIKDHMSWLTYKQNSKCYDKIEEHMVIHCIRLMKDTLAKVP